MVLNQWIGVNSALHWAQMVASKVNCTDFCWLPQSFNLFKTPNAAV